MPNVIELARYRDSHPRGAERLSTPTKDEITICLRRDTTHAWALSGAYAESPALAVQALTEVAADIATEALRRGGL